MPIKLIGFILLLCVLLGFVGFNLDNFTDITLWFNEKGQFKDVSVIIVVFVTYLLGIFSTVPFWFIRSRKKSRVAKKKKASKLSEQPSLSDGEEEKTKISPPRKRVLPRKKKTLADKNS